MTDIKKQLKKQREKNWSTFSDMDSDQKLATAALNGMEKTKRIVLCIRNFGTDFDSTILKLISKAQMTPENYFCLMLAFPIHVELWEEWQGAENEQDFFDKYLGSYNN